MSQSSSSLHSEEIFRASAPDIRTFAALLRAVCYSNSSQKARMTISEAALTIEVEEARSLTGTAWIRKELFDDYIFCAEQADDEEEERSIIFSFPLHVLLECLNIFGTASAGAQSVNHTSRNIRAHANEDSEGENGVNSSRPEANANSRRPKNDQNNKIDTYFPFGRGTGMRLSYAGEGHPLVLLLAESADGPTTSCEIVTYEGEAILDLSLDRENVVLRCILKSSWFQDALSEISPASEKITFVGHERNDSSSYLRIEAHGPQGSTEMDFPEKEVLETFECESSTSFCYRFAYIARILPALRGSSKTSLRIDSNGVLSLQFLSVSPSPTKGTQIDSVVEFRCLPIDDS